MASARPSAPGRSRVPAGSNGCPPGGGDPQRAAPMGSSGVAPLNGRNHFALQILGAPVEALCRGGAAPPPWHGTHRAACGCRKPCHRMRPGRIRGQAAGPVSPLRPGIRARSGCVSTSGGRVVVQRRVRPVRAVVIGVLIEDRPRMPFAGDQHRVRALAAGAGDLACGDHVRARRRDGRVDDPDADGGERRVECRGEFGIPVPDQDLGPSAWPSSGSGCCTDEWLPGQFHDHQQDRPLPSSPGRSSRHHDGLKAVVLPLSRKLAAAHRAGAGRNADGSGVRPGSHPPRRSRPAGAPGCSGLVLLGSSRP